MTITLALDAGLKTVLYTGAGLWFVAYCFKAWRETRY